MPSAARCSDHRWPLLVRIAAVLAVITTATLSCPVGIASPDATALGGLPRKSSHALEDFTSAKVAVEYGVLKTRDGVRLRTIVTRPREAAGRLPAILFVHWLSCSTVEAPASAKDGWSRMMQRLVSESHMLVWRTEKRGVGDSEGNCATLDYETELADHRAAFEALLRRPDVDPKRVVVFGASMGSNYAPLVAADHDVAGVMTWGGGAFTWFERQLQFERHELELKGTEPARLNDEIAARARFLTRFLIDGETPRAIAQSDPQLGQVWSRLNGTEGDTQWGRPLAFQQQAQRQNWPAAWAKVRAPVLVMYGGYDWFESVDAATRIPLIVNQVRPGTATLKVFPGYDHHFSRYPSAVAAYKEESGVADPGPMIETMLGWLTQQHLR